jgi:hypothetical protein
MLFISETKLETVSLRNEIDEADGVRFRHPKKGVESVQAPNRSRHSGDL